MGSINEKNRVRKSRDTAPLNASEDEAKIIRGIGTFSKFS